MFLVTLCQDVSFATWKLITSHGPYSRSGATTLAQACKKIADAGNNIIVVKKVRLFKMLRFPNKCRQIAPTPHGSLLQTPRASQVPYKANKNRRCSALFPINSRSSTRVNRMLNIKPGFIFTPSLHVWFRLKGAST